MGSIYGSRLRRTTAPLLQVVVYLIPMLVLGWQITLCLVGVNLVMLLVNTLFVNPIKTVTKRMSVANGKMTEKLSNLLQGMEQARMNTAGRQTVEEFAAENENYVKESRGKIFFTACLEGFNTGFDLLCALTFLMIGIYFVQKGYTTLGALTAIYSLYGSFSYQFLQLGRYLPELIGCLTNAQNIFEFMEEKKEAESWYPERNENPVLKSDEKYIDVSHIRFSYSEDKELLKDYSLYSHKGETIAITGPSGCGKSTLSKLLLGLYPIQSGDIRIDGKSYYDLSNQEIREMISYVPQEPYLFNVSVRENILIGKQDATEEEIIEAAKRAHAHEFIMNLENGYDSCVGERGNRLSGGQRQRIAIARAILKEAPVMLLDEATSALDNESEQLVNDAMKSMKKEKNIIMIAHRPSTIALADRICAFNGESY
ncbi:MAG: ABC transporter ATP-binding protein [Thermoflexaceae bacterium]|nr:ABC transporter ATP-binding protein [Thermoflexaceae bacterium]